MHQEEFFTELKECTAQEHQIVKKTLRKCSNYCDADTRQLIWRALDRQNGIGEEYVYAEYMKDEIMKRLIINFDEQIYITIYIQPILRCEHIFFVTHDDFEVFQKNMVDCLPRIKAVQAMQMRNIYKQIGQIIGNGRLKFIFNTQSDF